MGNDPHYAVAVCQTHKSIHGLLQCIVIQRTETLINKHGIQLDPARRGLDLLGKTKRQRQRGLERLAAGKRTDIPFAAVVVIDDVQIQTAVVAADRLGEILELEAEVKKGKE